MHDNFYGKMITDYFDYDIVYNSKSDLIEHNNDFVLVGRNALVSYPNKFPDDINSIFEENLDEYEPKSIDKNYFASKKSYYIKDSVYFFNKTTKEYYNYNDEDKKEKVRCNNTYYVLVDNFNEGKEDYYVLEDTITEGTTYYINTSGEFIEYAGDLSNDLIGSLYKKIQISVYRKASTIETWIIKDGGDYNRAIFRKKYNSDNKTTQYDSTPLCYLDGHAAWEPMVQEEIINGS